MPTKDGLPAKRPRAHARTRSRLTARRFGPGEYVAAGGNMPAVYARQLFLEAFSRLCPDAIDELQGEPLEECARIELFVEELLRLPPERWSPAIVAANSSPARTELDPTAAWVRRWRLLGSQGSWIECAIVETLVWWVRQRRASEPVGRDLIYSPREHAIVAPPEEWGRFVRAYYPVRHAVLPVRLRPAYWMPFQETRADAEARLRAAFEDDLKNGLDEIEVGLREEGHQPSPTKDATTRHFDWLVRFQCRGESMPEIAKRPGRGERTTPQAVEQAVKSMATLIGLARRPPDKGRPSRRASPPHTIKLKRRSP